MAYFESLGVPLKVERGNRVFPLSDRAGDVVEALQRKARRGGTTYLFADAEEIITEDGAAVGVRAGGGHIDSMRCC